MPELQQERLFNITAALYYGMHELQDLEAQGLIIPTPNREVKIAAVKSRSESGSTLSGNCRQILATAWAIAVGEPTPAGEIVAMVTTVIVGGILMYEVWLCGGSSSGGSSSDINEAYCQRRYLECLEKNYQYGTYRCEPCYRYCQTNGVWPGFDTHMCL